MILNITFSNDFYVAYYIKTLAIIAALLIPIITLVKEITRKPLTARRMWSEAEIAKITQLYHEFKVGLILNLYYKVLGCMFVCFLAYKINVFWLLFRLVCFFHLGAEYAFCFLWNYVVSKPLRKSIVSMDFTWYLETSKIIIGYTYQGYFKKCM